MSSDFKNHYECFRWQEGPILELDAIEDEQGYDAELADLSNKLPTLEKMKIKGVFIPENPAKDTYAVIDSSSSLSNTFKNLAEAAKKLGVL